MMHSVYELWAKELGLEVREDAFYRNGEFLYRGDPEAFLSGYEHALPLPEGRRKEIKSVCLKAMQEEQAYRQLLGTVAYILPDPKEFWDTIKLSWAYQQRCKVPGQSLSHSYLLYMGNTWGLILCVVTDEDSDVRTEMLKAIDAHMKSKCRTEKGVEILGENGELHQEFLSIAVAFYHNPKLKPAYTPEILNKIKAMMARKCNISKEEADDLVELTGSDRFSAYPKCVSYSKCKVSYSS